MINHKETQIRELHGTLNETYSQNLILKDKIQNLTNDIIILQKDNENKFSQLQESSQLILDKEKIIEIEKNKNKNLVNLIKELENRRPKIDSENNEGLKNQIETLNMKLQEIENKYRNKLEKKDLIIKKLDQSLVEYEEKLNSFYN